MPFRDPELALRDVLDAVELIEQSTFGLDFEDFRQDLKTVAAVERISEAAIRLGGVAETLCPGVPWRNVRGIGNWLRHQYDRIDLETVWKTVTRGLRKRVCFTSAIVKTAKLVPINVYNVACPGHPVPAREAIRWQHPQQA